MEGRQRSRAEDHPKEAFDFSSQCSSASSGPPSPCTQQLVERQFSSGDEEDNLFSPADGRSRESRKVQGLEDALESHFFEGGQGAAGQWELALVTRPRELNASLTEDTVGVERRVRAFSEGGPKRPGDRGSSSR